MRLLSNQDVEQVLDRHTCREALEAGYQDLIQQRAAYGATFTVGVPSDQDPDGSFRCASREGATRTPGVFAIRRKLDIRSFPGGQTEEKYGIQPGTFCGLILLVSTRNPQPLALIQDGYLQPLRVGGCGGRGVRYLARTAASPVGMRGSGGMARTSLRAFCEGRDLRQGRVSRPTPEHREAYAREMAEALDRAVEPVDNPRDAVREVDIVSVCTDPVTPAMDADWRQPGLHCTHLGGGTHPRLRAQAQIITVKLGYKGSYGGRMRADVPELIHLVAGGQLSTTQLITRRYGFDEVNVAYDALRQGQITGRAIVVMA